MSGDGSPAPGTAPPLPVRPARRLTVFLGAHDRVRHRSLAVSLVQLARRLGMAGVTVFRGHAGYGHSGRRHETHLLVDDAPETVVVVDRPERVDAFARAVGELDADLLVVVDDVEIVEL